MTNIALTADPYQQATLSHQAAPFIVADGINSLVSAAIPLLLLMIKLKETQLPQQQINTLRRQVLEEIIAFTNRAHTLECSPRLILAARYCLCTALDEVILSTSWGGQGNWANQTLLSTVQKETWGGERFFIILDEMTKAPQENLNLLELLYIILSLGFEGKYYSQEQSVRDDIRHRLFGLIMQYREEPQKLLSPSLANMQPAISLAKGWLNNWKITVISIAVLILFYFIGNFATYLNSRQILHDVTSVTIPSFTGQAAAVEKPPKHHRYNRHNKHDFSRYQ
jgi:type VI secretion system protein ImpK